MHTPKSKIQGIFLPLTALGFAVLVGGVVVLASGGDPLEAFFALIQGAFGTRANLAGTLAKTTPLLFTGLAVAIAFRAGLFNIGGEGQLYVGGLMAAWVGAACPHLPGPIHLPLTLISGLAAGALWAALPGWLKARRGVHEVVDTIMLNYVAIHLADYLVNGPLSAGEYAARTARIARTAELPALVYIPPIRVSWGIVLALGMCVLFHWMILRTRLGYEIRATGSNPNAAEYGGISTGRICILAMAISGALAGLAGAVEVAGLHHTFYAQFSPGYGFDGIAVALLARTHPLGVIPAAVLFGALRTADRWLQLKAGVPRDLVLILQAAVIFFVAVQTQWKPWQAADGRRQTSDPQGIP